MNMIVRGLPTAISHENKVRPDRFLDALIRWWRERREIARLSAYPDSMLKDICVSRSDIAWLVREGRYADAASPASKNGDRLEEKTRSSQRRNSSGAAYDPPDEFGKFAAAPIGRTAAARKTIAEFHEILRTPRDEGSRR